MTVYIENPSQVVKTSQQTVMLFTRGIHLKINEDGSGYSGKWVTTEEKLLGCRKVLLYVRDRVARVNKIYRGDYTGYHSSDIPGRLVIEFNHMEYIGLTNKNWIEFAGKGQSPIGIINE